MFKRKRPGAERMARASGARRSRATVFGLKLTRRSASSPVARAGNGGSANTQMRAEQKCGYGARNSAPRRSGPRFPGNSITVEQPGYTVDAPLLLAVLTLVLLGLVIAYATSYHQGWAHVQEHALRVGVGVLAFLLGITIPHRWYRGRFRWVILGLGFGLLVATMIYGRSVKGAERWLVLPVLNAPIQPAEIAKFALPFWLAAYFADLESRSEPEQGFVRMVLVPALVMFAFLVPTLLQRAIGTTFIMAVSALAVFLLAGVKVRYFLLLALAALALVLGGILAFPHGWDRVVGFFRGDRYQLEHARIAIARGQIWGQWLTGSRQAVFFLPEVRTDFTMAAICEEFGFIGSSGVFGLFGLFLWRGVTVSRRTQGNFGRILGAGIAVTVFLYAMVHIAVAIGFIPTTGQPLPFVSFGGTAMLSNLFAAGVLLNISRYDRRAVQASRSAGYQVQYARPATGRSLF